MQGNILAQCALYGTPFLIIALFSVLRPKLTVALSLVGGMLFLPMAEVGWIPFIQYDKIAAISIGLLLGVLLFDSERLGSLTFHPVDIPMLWWCSAGFMAAMTNDLGVYDSLSASSNTVLRWALPYFLGRLYFSDQEGLKILAWSLFLGGVVYLPLVWFELRMSPQAHRLVYGYMQHSFAQVIRFGGWRPMVFMQHGIMLGTWMCMAAMTGIWCYYSNTFPKKWLRMPLILIVLILTITAIGCKSIGAIGLLIMGLSILVITNKVKGGFLICIMLLLIPLLYIGVRASGLWDGHNLVDFVAQHISQERAQSLQFRFDNENILIDKALGKKFFGWGGWGRSRVYDPVTGEDISTTDGFWVITLGQNGYYGLIPVTLVLLLPMLLVLWHSPGRDWSRPEDAPAPVLSLIVLLFLIDSLPNSMYNPVYILLAGAVIGLFAARPVAQSLLYIPDVIQRLTPVRHLEKGIQIPERPGLLNISKYYSQMNKMHCKQVSEAKPQQKSPEKDSRAEVKETAMKPRSFKWSRQICSPHSPRQTKNITTTTRIGLPRQIVQDGPTKNSIADTVIRHQRSNISKKKDL